MFTPQSVGSISGVVTITGGGATAITVSVSGNGINSNPNPSTGVVISQIYGAGGNSGSLFNADYVELYNRTSTSQTLSGYSIQYASSSATTNWTGKSKLPTITIPSGGYYLVQMSSASTLNGAVLPTPDYISSPTISMSATSGRVALVSDTITLVGCPTTQNISDLVGYGTSICFETAAAPLLDTLHAGFRNNNGCVDTDNNQADFTAATPNPRNSSSPYNNCSGASTPTLSATTLTSFGDVVVSTNSVSQSFNVSGTDLTGAPGNITVTSPGPDFQVSLNGTTWSSSVTVPYSSATLSSTPVYVMFTPQSVGSISGVVTITGGGATAITVSVSGNGINSNPNPSTGVVISQIYGAGGNSGSLFNADYVELYNRTSTSQTLSGYSIQYASSSATTNWTGKSKLPTITIPSGGYYLVQMSSASTLNGAVLPTPDYISSPTISMSATSGRVALVSDTITLVGCPTTQNISDLVGYGTSICFETAAAPLLDTLHAGFRNNNGCVDTDNNQADFTAATPNPRNSSSPYNNCSSTPAPHLSATTLISFGDVVVSTNSASQTFNLSGTDLTGAPGNITVTSPGPDFQVSLNGTTWSSSVTVPYSSATLSATPVYVMFTPQSVGTISGVITIAGGGVSTNVTVSVSGNGVNAPSNTTLSATASIDFGNVCNFSIAGPNTFEINGTELTNADIIVGPQDGLSFSLTESGTYSPVLTISQSGGTFNQMIYVTFAPTAEGPFNGVVIISGGGTASPITVAATANVIASTSATITGDSSAITTNSAVLSGSILGGGCSSNISSYGIEYSGINGFIPGSGTQVLANNLSNNNFSASVSGLVQNTVYYYRAFSANAGGYAYGEQKAFFTLPISGGLVIYSNPLVRGTNVHYSLSGIKPGHYAVKLFNSVGQLVFQRDMIVQVDFIDDNFILPSKLPAGVYTFQVFNPEFNIQKPVLVH